MMTLALGTLPFLATLWLLVVVGAAVLEESGAKIAAALEGKAVRRWPPPVGRVSLRTPARPRPRRVEPPLRAAA
jgi:hypothetical protein